MANLNDGNKESPVNSNANNDNNEQIVYLTKKPPVQQANNQSVKETTKDETQTIQSEEPKSNLNKSVFIVIQAQIECGDIGELINGGSDI